MNKSTHLLSAPKSSGKSTHSPSGPPPSLFSSWFGKKKNSINEIVDDFSNLKFDSDKSVCEFLSQLPLVDPNSEQPPFLIWDNKFPLILQKHAAQEALEAWLSKLTPAAVNQPLKENQPIVLTSAPTGSGKTQFLRLICQLFRTKWNSKVFMDSLRSKVEIPADTVYQRIFDNTINSIDDILESAEIKSALSSGGELAQRFLDSTYPCFVTFNSTSPISQQEIQLIGHSPLHMLIARVIFTDVSLEDKASPWLIRYSDFLMNHHQKILRIPSLDPVVDFLKRRHNCEHFLLAIDELAMIDGVEPPKSEEKEDDAHKHRYRNSVRKVLKEIGSMVMCDPRLAVIVSSLVTGPLDEYVTHSHHTHAFIHLPTLLDEVGMLAEVVAHYRQDTGSVAPVRRMLLSSGGHPMLLSHLLKWLSNPRVPCEAMTLDEAVTKCKLDRDTFSNVEVQEAIIDGVKASSEVVNLLAGVPGMLTRPTSVAMPTFVIASPMVLYLVVSKCPQISNSRSLDLKELILSEIGDFEYFVVNWIALRFKRGATLQTLIHTKGGNVALQSQIKISQTQPVLDYINENLFMDILPTACSLVNLNKKQRPGEDFLYGMETDFEGIKVSRPICEQTAGFDALVSLKQEKKVLIIHCKAQEVASGEIQHRGMAINADSIGNIIKQSVVQTDSFLKNGWSVSLLVLCACQTSSRALSDCLTSPFNCAEKALLDRSCIIAKSALRDFFGPSFGLALELAQGKLYHDK